jgi:hypothetical protein
MRHLEIKHPEYGRFGKFDAYDTKDLIHGPELPKRIDFHPVGIPNRTPSDVDKNTVSKKSIEILKQIFLDDQPLADLYNWELHVSSHNPHGTWAEPKWRYYMVGSLKDMAEARKFTDVDAEKKTGIVHSYKSSDPSQTLYQLIRRMKGDPTLKVPVTGKDVEFNPDVIKKELNEYSGNDTDYMAPMVFDVLKPIKLWIYTGESRPTNAYYGNSQIFEPPNAPFTLRPGMQLWWGHNGTFIAVKPEDRVVYHALLFEPKHPFEKSYGNYKDLWFKKHVEDGDLRIAGTEIPSGAKIYKIHGLQNIKEMVKEAVLSIMNERI